MHIFDLISLFNSQKTFSDSVSVSSASQILKMLFKVIIFNDVIIYKLEKTNFFVKIVEDFLILWHDIDLANMSEHNWRRIFLKSNWINRVSNKIKIYFLKTKNKQLINNTFDELYCIDKLFWTNEFTSFLYFVFCVWKKIDDERKKRVVIDIRDFNVITQSNINFFVFAKRHIYFDA